MLLVECQCEDNASKRAAFRVLNVAISMNSDLNYLGAFLEATGGFLVAIKLNSSNAPDINTCTVRMPQAFFTFSIKD